MICRKEEQMEQSHENKEGQGCCGHSACCSGRKCLVSILIGLSLIVLGFGLAKANFCAVKTCPVVQMQK